MARTTSFDHKSAVRSVYTVYKASVYSYPGKERKGRKSFSKSYWENKGLNPTKYITVKPHVQETGDLSEGWSCLTVWSQLMRLTSFLTHKILKINLPKIYGQNCGGLLGRGR